jgi:hypothetical protein
MPERQGVFAGFRVRPHHRVLGLVHVGDEFLAVLLEFTSTSLTDVVRMSFG